MTRADERRGDASPAAGLSPSSADVRYLLTPPLNGAFTPVGSVLCLELGVTTAKLQHRRRLLAGDHGVLRLSTTAGSIQTPAKVVKCARIHGEEAGDLPFVSFIEARVSADVIQALVRDDHAAAIRELRDSDRFTLAIPQPASFVDSVTVLDLSESGARIQHSQQILPQTRSRFSVSLPGGVNFTATAAVMWSRLQNDGKAISYVAGLRFENRQRELKQALWRLHEQQIVRPDVEGLRTKLAVVRSRSIESARRLRQLGHQAAIDHDIVLMVRHVRQQLRSHPQEAARWYNKAKFADADPEIRSLVEQFPFKEEMLAIWEYLDRTVDLRKIVRVCTTEE